ncbi:MAG: DUF4214 domain-containing protein [Pseudomonadota bacterium]
MPANTLFIGHSLIGKELPNMFNSIMTDMGRASQAEAQIINGAPLIWNWENGARAEGVNARAVLPNGQYDTVIITEASPLQDHIAWNNTHGYAERYLDLALSSNPSTSFFVYETWPRLDSSVANWRAQLANDLSAWNSVVAHLNASKPASAPTVKLIPAAQAMANLHDAILEGDVSGLSQITDLFSDDIHLNDVGMWFIAALHLQALTGIHASTLPLQTYDEWGVPYAAPSRALANDMLEVIEATFAATGDGVPDQAAPIVVTGGELDDVLSGDEAINFIDGFAGDDTLSGGMSDDTLVGGDGVDVARMSGPRETYTLSLEFGNIRITDRRDGMDGTDQLIEIEEIEFSGGAGDRIGLAQVSGGLSLSETVLEGFVELYIAYFNRAPDALGLNFWATAYANGLNLPQIAALFNDQAETRSLYPENMSDADVVTAVYDNVLGRASDADGFAFWRDALASGSLTREQFILSVLEGAKAEAPAGASPAFANQQAADRAYLEDKTDIGSYFAVHLGMSNVQDAALVMSLYTGSNASLQSAVSRIDEIHNDILSGSEDALLMPLLGVLSDPDWS